MPPRPRSLSYVLSAPLRAFFTPRFEALASGLRSVGSALDQHATNTERAAAATEDAVRSELWRTRDELLAAHGVLARSIDQTVDAVTVLLERTDPATMESSEHLARQIATFLGRRSSGDFDPDRDGTLRGLDDELAAIANFALSHRSWASQAGLWFNPPVSVEHAAHGVRLADVNERIGEVPFVHAALGSLPPGSSILDVGATESTVAFGLASLGHQVTALDPRPYPFDHENLTVHVGPLETLPPGEPYDAVVFLSSVEHFGLGAYDLPVDDGADVSALRLARERVRPGGLLVLTTPFGDVPTNEVQRTYTPDQLALLLDGWEILEQSYLTQTSRTHWHRVENVPDLRGAHVALVRARRPQA